MANYQHIEERQYDPLYPTVTTPAFKKISWSAVFAGVVISIVIYLLLIILGSAIGATTVDPLQEEHPLNGLATGAAIWTGISMIISAAVGGFVGGWLAYRHGAVHGVLVFGVNTLICTTFLLMLANSATTGALNIVGSGMQAVGSGIKSVAPSVVQVAKEKMDEKFKPSQSVAAAHAHIVDTGKRTFICDWSACVRVNNACGKYFMGLYC